jgi:ABC-type Fe3+ transport system permease subunit
MLRRHFIAFFLILAITFVPVIFYFGLVVFIVPTSWGFASTFHQLCRAEFPIACMYSIYCAIFTAIFYGFGRLAFWMTSLVESKRGRITAQSAILLALFACSFIKALTYGSIAGRGGTYTFWGAAERFLEKRIWR